MVTHTVLSVLFLGCTFHSSMLFVLAIRIGGQSCFSLCYREKMAEAAVTFLLENVKKLLVEQIKLISGAEKDLEDLKEELELMKAFLRDSASKREKGDLFIQYEKQIRDKVYKTEDVIDTCLTAKAKSSKSFKLGQHLDLARTVRDLRLKELQPMFDRAMNAISALPLRKSGFVSKSGRYKLRKIQQLREDKIVGFADEEAILIKYLGEKTDELDVISIVGMPGLGKTTLAYKLFRDRNLQFNFPVMIWVYVSQDFNVRDVFLTILKKLTPQDDMSSKDNQELNNLVKQHLKHKKCLIFMDDVWNIADWKQIENALPVSNHQIKVLITSRNERVATQANPNREPHHLRFLNSDESWELLQLEVFGKNISCPTELEVLGKQISLQCGGVPLAIVVIGGILMEKSDNRKDFWKNVSDSVTDYFKYDEQKRTKEIISLSYDKLPHDLRDCFLYLGMFPEDSEIPAWKLTRLWIAEGFIQQNQVRSLEEVAEDNLNELVARNLAMVDKAKADGGIKTCRVHDMIREFCRNEAAYENKNMFQEVKKTRYGEFDPPISEIVKRRRLCIHSNVVEFLRKKPLKGPGVRSFVCFSEETINLQNELTTAIPEAFELLRVIDGDSIKFPKFPPNLTKLIHLRYITFYGDNLTALPKAMSKLWNLQTVKITTSSRDLEIRPDIGEMMQLRHLKSKSAVRVSEIRGKGGENLQTLSRLSTTCCSEELFNRIPNLKNLGIRGDLKAMNARCLEKLDYLEKLKLLHDVFHESVDGKSLKDLPREQNFPPNLRILTLSSTSLSWSHMTTLGRLHNLEVLKLKEMAFKGTRWESKGGGFRSLETLHFLRIDLEKWTALDNPFPRLKNLVLKNCEKLQDIPTVVWGNLQLMELERVHEKLVHLAKRMEKEKHQVEEQQRVRKGGFKLKISPGDHASASTSSSPN